MNSNAHNKYRNIVYILMVLILTYNNPTFAASSDAKTELVKMHTLNYTGAKIIDRDVIDSYGNKYTGNIIEMKATEYPVLIYRLNGEYERFSGNIVASQETNREALIDFAIFADKKLVFKSSGITKQSAPIPFDIDLSGVGLLEIKSSPSIYKQGKSIREKNAYNSYLYLVNSFFFSSSNPTDYVPCSDLLSQTLIDSSRRFKSEPRLIQDSYGNLHNGYIMFNTSREEYAVYNLNKQFETFTASVVSTPYTISESIMNIKIFLDGKTAYTKNGIKKSDALASIKLDVTGVSVMKIVTSASNKKRHYDGYLYLVDDTLRPHEHSASGWLVKEPATCTEHGSQIQKCDKCGQVFNTQVINPLGHSPIEKWDMIQIATCNHEGKEILRCKICNEAAEVRTHAKTPHAPVNEWKVVKEITCIEDGRKARLCSVCGEEAEVEILPKIAHSYGEWKRLSGSIWNAPIVEERVCSICGTVDHQESNPIPWLKPLVYALLALIVGGTILLSVTLRMNGMSLHPSNFKKIFTKDQATDDEIDHILKK